MRQAGWAVVFLEVLLNSRYRHTSDKIAGCFIDLTLANSHVSPLVGKV